LKRKRDIRIKTIKPSQNTAFMWTPALKGIYHASAPAQQFDFLSDGTFFKVINVKEIPFHRPYEACENSDTDIEKKNCSVDHDRFTRHILCLELKTVEKKRFPRKRIFKPARNESYLQSVYLN